MSAKERQREHLQRLEDRILALENKNMLLSISLRNADEQVRHLEGELMAAKLALELLKRKQGERQ